MRWRVDVGIQSWLNSPVIAGGYVFVGSSGSSWNKPDASDGVYAIGLKDGEVRWFAPTEGDVNGVVYADCLVISTSDDGHVRAHRATSGDLAWSRSFADRKVYTHPLVIARTIFVGDSDGRVHALDLKSGATVWENDMGAPVRGGLASDGVRVYAGAENGSLKAFDATTGSETWAASLAPWAIYGVPTVVASKVVIGFVRDSTHSSPALAAFDAETGEPDWRASNPRGFQGGWGNVRSSPAVWRDHLIWGEPHSNRIVALQIESGEIVWSTPAGPCTFPHWPSPAVVRDHILIPRHDGGLYMLDASNGELEWSYFLGDRTRVGSAFPESYSRARWNACESDPPIGRPVFASPAIAPDGTIVIGTGEGVLFAIQQSRD